MARKTSHSGTLLAQGAHLLSLEIGERDSDPKVTELVSGSSGSRSEVSASPVGATKVARRSYTASLRGDISLSLPLLSGR